MSKQALARWNTGLKWLGSAVLVGCGGAPDVGTTSDDASRTPDALTALPARDNEVTVDVERVEPVVSPPAEPTPSVEPVESSGEIGPLPWDSGECPSPRYPATSWSAGEWVPYPSGELSKAADAQSLLRAVLAAMPGDWHGIATTPWTNPYEVDVRFDEGGGYSARCSNLPGCCLAFYYGTDDDTPLKQWRVDDATLTGNVFGEIDIAFDYFPEYGLPAWQGELSHIQRDASGDGLRFEFARSDGYGPVRFDLRRVP